MSTRRGSASSGVVATIFAMLLVASCSSADPDPRATSPADVAESPSSNVRILDDCPELPCEGPLEPGKYRWAFHEPTIDFEVPSAGWSWSFSGGGNFRIIADDTMTHEGLYVSDGVYFLHDPTIASRDCEDGSQPGVGRSVGDLVAWLESAPGLTVSEPAPVTVGGLEGTQVDIALDPAWKRPCFFSEGMPAVPLIFNGAELGGYQMTIVPDQSMRWSILGSDGGVVIVALEDDPGGLSREELFQAGGQIVESLAFPPP